MVHTPKPPPPVPHRRVDQIIGLFPARVLTWLGMRDLLWYGMLFLLVGAGWLAYYLFSVQNALLGQVLPRNFSDMPTVTLKGVDMEQLTHLKREFRLQAAEGYLDQPNHRTILNKVAFTAEVTTEDHTHQVITGTSNTAVWAGHALNFKGNVNLRQGANTLIQGDDLVYAPERSQVLMAGPVLILHNDMRYLVEDMEYRLKTQKITFKKPVFSK